MKIGSPLPRKRARIEIIPLIDIMFFLLAAFMMASLSMIRLQSIGMDLPAASTARRDFKPDILNIVVDRAGDIYVDNERLSLPELHERVAARFRADANVPVYISGDKNASHGSVIRVLDVVRSEGISRVSFAIAPAEVAAPVTRE